MIWNILLTPEFFLVLISFCKFPYKWFAKFTVKLAKKFGWNNTMYYLYKIRQWTQLVAITWWSPEGQSWPWVYKKGQKGKCHYVYAIFYCESDSQVCSQPLPGTFGTLGGHSDFTWYILGTHYSPITLFVDMGTCNLHMSPFWGTCSAMCPLNVWWWTSKWSRGSFNDVFSTISITALPYQLTCLVFGGGWFGYGWSQPSE